MPENQRNKKEQEEQSGAKQSRNALRENSGWIPDEDPVDYSKLYKKQTGRNLEDSLFD